jgi:hypothetical protein
LAGEARKYAIAGWRARTLCQACARWIDLRFGVEPHLIPDVAAIVGDYMGSPEEKKIVE